ncbi:MAG TPA: DinB family protein [Chloroflexia bacterium]|nr:DinB family protein [Chloroflexia bacterium]
MSETTPTAPDLNDRRTRLKYKMAEARQELVSTLQALTPEQLSLPTRNEGWNVGQVAAHICAAEGGMEPIAHRILSQEPNQRENAASFDLNRFNNGMIKRRVDKTIPELIEELNTSRARMLEIIDRVSDEELDLPGYHPAAGDITLYGLFVVIYRHERDHAEDIRKAVEAGTATSV